MPIVSLTDQASEKPSQTPECGCVREGEANGREEQTWESEVLPQQQV